MRLIFFLLPLATMFVARQFSVVARRSGAITAAARSKHTLPDLPYDYNALAPTVSADIMSLHHSKHHNVGCVSSGDDACESHVVSFLPLPHAVLLELSRNLTRFCLPGSRAGKCRHTSPT